MWSWNIISYIYVDLCWVSSLRGASLLALLTKKINHRSHKHWLATRLGSGSCLVNFLYKWTCVTFKQLLCVKIYWWHCCITTRFWLMNHLISPKYKNCINLFDNIFLLNAEKTKGAHFILQEAWSILYSSYHRQQQAWECVEKFQYLGNINDDNTRRCSRKELKGL